MTVAGASTGTRPPTLYTVPETCQLLRVSRWTFYKLINDGELRTVTIGRRRLVSTIDLDAYLQRLRESAS